LSLPLAGQVEEEYFGMRLLLEAQLIGRAFPRDPDESSDIRSGSATTTAYARPHLSSSPDERPDLGVVCNGGHGRFAGLLGAMAKVITFVLAPRYCRLLICWST